MKTLITTFLSIFIYTAPVTLGAQPTVTNNEYYNVGDVISMVNCDPAGISAGPAGAGVTWDFSTIASLGGLSTTSVLHDTSSAFLTSNLLIILPDSTRLHVQENSSDSYIHGREETGANTINYYNYNISKRPFTYNSYYLDTYRVSVPATSSFGTGVLTETGDAYGTLKLPTGTFNNVLRIKKHQSEVDTFGFGIVSTTTVSYLWFDGVHTAPLFQFDSVISVLGYTQRAMYLALPVSTRIYNSRESRMAAYLSNSELIITDKFEQGKMYEVYIYNIIGAKVFRDEFEGDGERQRIDVGIRINPGIYIVSIQQRNDPSTRQMIKVVAR